jgi:uncharacterized protein (TIGR02466 family)
MPIKPIFSSFVYSEDLNIDTGLLEKYSYELAKTDPGVLGSNVGGWQSNNIIKNEKFEPLVTLIKEHVHILSKEIGLNTAKIKLEISNIWVNINGRYQYNRAHSHPGAIFAGVFYVKAAPYAGNLELTNPINVFEYVYPKNNQLIPTQFNSDVYRILPEVGKLSMFSSWLLHNTEPNLSNTERISIAFNIILKQV